MSRAVRAATLTVVALALASSGYADGSDNSRLAYTVTTNDRYGRRYALYTVDIEGRDVRLLSVQPRPIGGIDWSPHGTRIAFSDSWMSGQSLWTVGLQGALDLDWYTLNEHWDDSYPSWSPDGTLMAMMSNRAGNDEIHIVNAGEVDEDRIEYSREHDPANITHTPVDERWPAWSPKGDLVAFVSDRSGTLQIHLMDPDGANVRQVTYARDFPTGVTRPPMAWSPDGATLAFSASTGERFDIHALRLVDGSVRRLTRSDGHDWSPTYSPDGRRIAFVSSRRRTGKKPSAARIWMMDADGSSPEFVTGGGGGDVTLVDWSPPLPAAGR